MKYNLDLIKRNLESPFGNKLEIPHLTYIKNSLKEYYYENLQVRCAIPHDNWKIHGVVKFWYRNGNLMSEVPFYYGKKHGIVKEWYENRQIASEVLYEHGKKHKIAKYWYENGNIQGEVSWNNGRLQGIMKIYYDTGNKAFEISYNNNRKHGIEKHFNEDGNLALMKAYFRDVEIPVQMYLHPETIAVEQILLEKNAARISVFIELVGYERFLSRIPHEIIHSDGEYSLLSIKWHKEEEPIMLLKVKCPSSNVKYILRVPSDVKTCKEALAWSFNMKEEEYVLVEET